MNTLSPYKIQIIGASALAVALLFSVSALVFAVDYPTTTNAHLQSGTQNSQTMKEGMGMHLQSAKLKACQAKENGIKNRSTHLTDLVKNMEDTFDAIAQRVETYYTDTVVPSGKTVANYDTLVADIQTEKTAVETALTKAQTDFAGFSCTANDPKGTMVKFREDMQLVKKALKDYRTSIKNLIVAVHSVTGETNNNSNPGETDQHPNIPARPGQGNSGQ